MKKEKKIDLLQVKTLPILNGYKKENKENKENKDIFLITIYAPVYIFNNFY